MVYRSFFKVVAVIALLVHLSSARFLVSAPVLKVLYGNIGQIDDLMLPKPSESRRADMDINIDATTATTDNDASYGDQAELPAFKDFLSEIEEIQQWSLELNKTSRDLHIKELNDVSKTLIELKTDLELVAKDHNVTRRQEVPQMELPSEVNQLWRDPIQLREWYYMKLSLTFLIHIRFQVDVAIRQKMASNFMPSYRVGYLFHKIVKIQKKMYRILEEWNSMKVQRMMQNRPNWRTKKHNLHLVLQLYERMLELDVDSKDTMEMIKMQYYGRPQFVTQEYVASTKPFFKK